MHYLLHFTGLECTVNDSVIRKSQGVKSRVYGRWGRHLKWMSLIISAVTMAVFGLALSCRNKTPALSSRQCSDLMAALKMFSKEVAIQSTDDCGSLAPVLLYSYRWALQSQNSISITFPADAWGWNFGGFGELKCQHSSLALFVSGWQKWTQLSSPVTKCFRKPPPSVSYCHKSG
jgi:hypothetical protein